MQTSLAHVNAKRYTSVQVCDHRHMAQRDLVAAHRAFKTAEARAKQTREALDEAIREAVKSGEWQIVDVSNLTGWSRETIRKIVNANV